MPISKEHEEKARDFADKVDVLIREYLQVVPAEAVIAGMLGLAASLAMSMGVAGGRFTFYAAEAYTEMQRQEKENERKETH